MHDVAHIRCIHDGVYAPEYSYSAVDAQDGSHISDNIASRSLSRHTFDDVQQRRERTATLMPEGSMGASRAQANFVVPV